MTDTPDLELFLPSGPPHIVENINSIVGAAFRAANAKRARSQQKTLGMSELGGCRRQAGFKVLGFEPSNPQEERTDKYADSREAMIGTMIHETILPQIQAMSLTAEIEVPVVLRFDGLPEIPGSSDLIDASEGLILDIKGLALDTPIPTPSGWTTMAMLQVGDQVFDRYGNPCAVTATSEVKNIGCYRVDFNGIGSIVCDEEHIWVARSGSLSWKKNREVHPRSIADLERAWLNGENIAVPVTKPLDLPESDLPIHPWVLGYWLGNGNKHSNNITCHGDDAVNIRLLVNESGYETGEPGFDKRGSSTASMTIHGLVQQLRDCNLIGNKHVPDAYLRASQEQRLALLQGLMDSDGTWHRKRNRAVFTSTNRALAESAREIITSLGWRAQWQEVIRTGFGKTVAAYDVHFTPWDMTPFRLKRKADLVVVPEKKDRRWHQISGIQRIESVPTRCISVDSEDRTYLAGKAMVPTHNTIGGYGADFVKSRGPSKKHLWQTHGYATAAIQAGISITCIALVYIDRADGQVVHVHYQDYDPHIVADMELWWREVNSTDDPFTLPRDEKGPGLSKMCDWCCKPGTLVLLPDFTWRPIEDIQVGDVIMGRADAESHRKSSGKLVPTVVTAARRRTAPLVRVNGDLTVAEDKRFWTKSGWTETSRLTGKSAQFVTAPIKRDQEMYERGWLAGMAEGDGTFWWIRDKKGEERWRYFRLALKDDADLLLERFEEYALNAGFSIRRGEHTHTSFNGMTSKMPSIRMVNADARRFEEWISEDIDDESWLWGYLGGICDAEGCVTGKVGTIRISQYAHKNEDTYERIGRILRRVGFNPVSEWNGWRIKSAKGEVFRFLAGATPARPQFANLGLNRAPQNSVLIHEVSPAGEGEVVSLTTETGSYIAEGYVVHNCEWLNACWGPDAVPGQKGAQRVVLDEVPPSERRDEIEEYLKRYKEASDREREAKEDKAFSREVLVGVDSGVYGSMTLKWGNPSTYEQLDTSAAEAALTAAGLPVPKVERSRDARIDVKRAK